MDYSTWRFQDVFFLISVDNASRLPFIRRPRWTSRKYNITNFQAFRVVHYAPWKYRIENNDSSSRGASVFLLRHSQFVGNFLNYAAVADRKQDFEIVIRHVQYTLIGSDYFRSMTELFENSAREKQLL